MHITTVSLPVADQERARDFYTGVLGFGVRTDNPVPMGRWLEVAPSTSGPAFLLCSWLPQPTPVGGLILSAPDVDALCAKLSAAGVAYEGPADLPWGRQVTFADPDGNHLVVNQA